MKNKRFKVSLFFAKRIADKEEFTVEAEDEKAAFEKAKKLSSLRKVLGCKSNEIGGIVTTDDLCM